LEELGASVMKLLVQVHRVCQVGRPFQAVN
jgi:hypothetical protein